MKSVDARQNLNISLYPHVCVLVSVRPSPFVCVCLCVCAVAVQKMAEAHMQKLGVYPLEDSYEGEEDEDRWHGEEGEDTSSTKTAGERGESLWTAMDTTTTLCL